MALEQTEAIVLKIFDYGEADRIVHFLTENHGLVHGFTRGARKHKSRFAGRIDLLNHGHLRFFEKQHDKLAAINEFEILNSFPMLKQDLDRFYRASIMAELAHIVTLSGSPDRQLFKIMLAFLKVLDHPSSHSRTLLVLFEIFLIHHEGYAPPLDRCPHCQGKPNFPLFWLATPNRFVCSACRTDSSLPGLPLPQDLVDTFKMMRNPNINALVGTHLDDPILEAAERFCFEYLRFHFDFQARTEKMYQMLNDLS
ncbi:DNA repair protein RecO [bacterium]|nr:DNA repair protein RecO [bacterium]